MHGYSGIDFLDDIRPLCGLRIDTNAVVEFANLLNIGIPMGAPIKRTAISYATVCCETDYIFSSKELDWIAYAPEICEVSLDNHHLLVFVHVECDIDDYYLYCAALVKLLSHVKNEDSLYIFQFNTGIAFGCKRAQRTGKDGNFCVSSRISIDEKTQVLKPSDEELLYNIMLSDWEDYPEIIMDDVLHIEQIQEIPKYDKLKYDYDHIAFLLKISETFGVNTSRQIEEYRSAYEDKPKAFLSYQEVVRILSDIGEDPQSSYEVLDAAEAAEELARNIPVNNEHAENEKTNNAEDTILRQFSEEALKNAELLLKEMMQK